VIPDWSAYKTRDQQITSIVSLGVLETPGRIPGPIDKTIDYNARPLGSVDEACRFKRVQPQRRRMCAKMCVCVRWPCAIEYFRWLVTHPLIDGERRACWNEDSSTPSSYASTLRPDNPTLVRLHQDATVRMMLS